MGMMEGVWKWFGVEREEVHEEIIDMSDGTDSDPKTTAGNLVSIRGVKTSKVIICEPESFDEVQALADHLKNRKQLIMNFDHTPADISQRIIDFISGTTYSLEGYSQQLGKNIVMFTPSNVEITKDHRSLGRKSSFGVSNPFGGER